MMYYFWLLNAYIINTLKSLGKFFYVTDTVIWEMVEGVNTNTCAWKY